MMSVFIECINVVVRTHIIAMKYPGGLKTYEHDCPNDTYCSDGTLTRVGFMSPHDTAQFVQGLERHGLTFFNGTESVDIVVIDQNSGPTARCSWIDWGQISPGLTGAWLRGSSPGRLAVPHDVVPGEDRKIHFVTESRRDDLIYQGHEGVVDKFVDSETETVLYTTPTSRVNPGGRSGARAENETLAEAEAQRAPSRIAGLFSLASNVVLAGCVVGAVVGAVNDGFAGAATGIIVPFLASVALKTGAQRRARYQLAALLGTASVIIAALLGGWSWGWATSLFGLIVSLAIGRLMA